MNTIDEIKKLKELFDAGAITQNEFNNLKQNLISPIGNSTPSVDEITKEVVIDEIQNDETSPEEAIKMLTEMDIKCSQQNLIYYSYEGNFKVVKLLIMAGLSPNITFIDENNNIQYALYFAAKGGHVSVIEFLLKKGAGINSKDENGYTAIFGAIKKGKTEAVKILIENGADVNVKANQGETPLYWALENEKYNIAEILKNAGAKEITSNASNDINYIAIIATVVVVISVFLPWVETSSSVSYQGYHGSYSSGGINGFASGIGIAGLLLGIMGGIMAFNRAKYSFVLGLVNVLCGLGDIFGWFSFNGGASFSSSFGGGSVSAKINPQFGLILFVIASLVFTISTLKYLYARAD
jgi:hypothetical protein